MSLRETLNNNPAAVTGGAVVVLLLCLFMVYCQLTGGGTSDYTAQLIYYDVANKQIKLVEWKEGPQPNSPLDGSPDVYEATLFSCGECPEGPDGITDGMTLEDVKAKGMYPGWITKRDPNTEAEAFMNPTMMCQPFGSNRWYQAASSAWQAKEDQIRRGCNGGKDYAVDCYAPFKQ